MLYFSRHERLALFFLGLILLAGVSLHYVFKKMPYLADAVNIIDSPYIYRKVDVNMATEEELVRIPYIGSSTAKKIITFREISGRIVAVKDVSDIPGINRAHFEKFKRFLEVKK